MPLGPRTASLHTLMSLPREEIRSAHSLEDSKFRSAFSMTAAQFRYRQSFCSSASSGSIVHQCDHSIVSVGFLFKEKWDSDACGRGNRKNISQKCSVGKQSLVYCLLNKPVSSVLEALRTKSPFMLTPPSEGEVVEHDTCTAKHICRVKQGLQEADKSEFVYFLWNYLAFHDLHTPHKATFM